MDIMDFLIANQNLLISLGVLIGIIIIGLILIPYLKKHGYIKQEDLENTKVSLEIANALINVLKFDQKDIIVSIFNIVETVVDYMAESLDDKDKDKIAYEATMKILQELNVQIDKNIEELVELAINISLGKIEN